MSVEVLKNASVVYNSVDLSDHVEQIDLPAQLAKIITTAMGDDTEKSIPGLKNTTVTVTFQQDYAGGSVDDTLWTAYNGGTSHSLVIKPKNEAVSATNPSYTITAWVQSYPPISGQVGEVQRPQAVFEISSGDLARATA